MTRPRDPGLQAERTALSWNRTGLAILANALLALREGWQSQQAPISLLACALLVAALAAWVYGTCRRRQLLSDQPVVAVPALAIAIASVVTLLACVVATLVLGASLYR